MQRLIFIALGGAFLWAFVATSWLISAKEEARAQTGVIRQMEARAQASAEQYARVDKERKYWKGVADELSQMEGANDEIINPYLRSVLDRVRTPRE